MQHIEFLAQLTGMTRGEPHPDHFPLWWKRDLPGGDYFYVDVLDDTIFFGTAIASRKYRKDREGLITSDYATLEVIARLFTHRVPTQEVGIPKGDPKGVLEICKDLVASGFDLTAESLRLRSAEKTRTVLSGLR